MQQPTSQTAGDVVSAVLPNDFITPKEAAHQLRVSKAALYEWLGRGDLPCYRLGRAIRIRAQHLLEFTQHRRSEPTARPPRYASRRAP